MIAGHSAVREELEQELPPVTLLLGPESVGKLTLAMHLAMLHCRQPSLSVHPTADQARQIVHRAPLRCTPPDVYVIGLDGSTDTAQNILLKVLEEPPSHTRFILTASRNPLPTIMSRSRIYRLGLLTDAQVAQVLCENGASEQAAERAAAHSRGQVAPAMEAVLADKESSRVTSVVAAAVRAAVAGGGTALGMALRNWTSEHTRVLAQWAAEAASGRWVYFTADFAPGVSRDGAIRLLYVLSTYDARTGPAVALDILRERS